AMRTGGVGAYIPIAQQSVEQSRAATSNTMQGIEASLARAGLGRTPFGQNILAQAAETGALDVESIYPSIVKSLISVAPSFALGSASTIVNALARFGTTQGKQSGSWEQTGWNANVSAGSSGG